MYTFLSWIESQHYSRYSLLILEWLWHDNFYITDILGPIFIYLVYIIIYILYIFSKYDILVYNGKKTKFLLHWISIEWRNITNI